MQFKTPRVVFCASIIIFAHLLTRRFHSPPPENLMNARRLLLIYFLMVLLYDWVGMGVNHNIIMGRRITFKGEMRDS